MGKIVIIVPATSSNLGAGINSLGIAFKLYSTVIVEEKTDHWIVNHSLPGIPHDANNLIVQTILRIDPKIAPRQLTVMSDIPSARGLGASTSAIIAGVKIANALGHLHLSLKQQINVGGRFVGHPECVSSGILGDLTASASDGRTVTTVKAKMPAVLALMYIMKNRPRITGKIRPQLNRVKLPEVIKAVEISNVLIAAVMDNHWDKASKIMEDDPIAQHRQFHEVPDLKLIRSVAHRLGIYSTYLNGVGPIIVTFGEKVALNRLRRKLSHYSSLDGTFRLLGIDRSGTTVRGE